MRYWALTGILLLSYLIQSVLGPFLAIGGVVPNVVLVVVVSFGLLFGWQVGLGTGFAGGLLIDLTIGQLIGSHALALSLVGLVAGLVEERVFKDNLILAGLGGVVGSLIGQVVMLLCIWLFGRAVSLAEFRSTLLPSVLYDTALCVLVYWRIYRLYGYLRPDPRGTIVLRRR
jgi:rod shape-determining protein MreD